MAYVNAAPDGRDAISMLQTLPFNVVLLDVMMPNIGGLDEVNPPGSCTLSSSNLPALSLTVSGRLLLEFEDSAKYSISVAFLCKLH